MAAREPGDGADSSMRRGCRAVQVAYPDRDVAAPGVQRVLGDGVPEVLNMAMASSAVTGTMAMPMLRMARRVASASNPTAIDATGLSPGRPPCRRRHKAVATTPTTTSGAPTKA